MATTNSDSASMGGSVSASTDIKTSNVDFMSADRGYKIVIVCCGDGQQASYWQNRLEQEDRKGLVLPKDSTVIAVDEDWPGGAGNFLGTLYAWKKACAKLKETQQRDLAAELAAGASVALYHTAGKGTRMAPLPGGENNNKPGVKLPVPGDISILESVIRQTGAYAPSRGGRLSVFWGDQIFVPSVSCTYTPKHHADILCGLGPMPSEQEWNERGLSKYGCIVADSDNSVIKQLEKVSHADAAEQVKPENLNRKESREFCSFKSAADDVVRVGPSLGSFSLSAAFLTALEGGFSAELEKKAGKMDSDPHLWMAMTLGADAYSALVLKKDLFGNDKEAKDHHSRVAEIVKNFDAGSMGMFGAVDVGMDMSWWDYGMLALYSSNSLLLTGDSKDAVLVRRFFGVKDDKRISDDSKCEAAVDNSSVVSATTAKTGKISCSVVANVTCKDIAADNALLVGCSATKIVAGRNSIGYNLVDESDAGITLAENEVRVGVFTLDRPYFEMKSDVAKTDGGKVFKEKVHGNNLSFQDVYDLNHNTDVTACSKKAQEARDNFKKKAAL